MASRSSTPAINGPGHRRCRSWIESFVEHTANLEAAPLYRKWAAISLLAATLEQKVSIDTGSLLYPNLYVFLVGRPGIGKSRTITAALSVFRELPDPKVGATSMTMAALVDHLHESKRVIIRQGEPTIDYNTMLIAADELSAFMDTFETGLIAGLTTFYDCVPYSQGRRVKDIRIKIAAPQLNILSGTTPSNLMRFIPDYAWEQGFTSRVIMVYAEDQPLIDIFNTPKPEKAVDLIHDLKVINALSGICGWNDEYANAMNNWKTLGCPPKPEHPKLEHYCSRRFSHLLKLTMIANVDRVGHLYLTKEDFNKAMGWLLEVELAMPNVFTQGFIIADAKVMDEIHHHLKGFPDGLDEMRLLRFAKNLIPLQTITKVFAIMEQSGMIKAVNITKEGLRTYKAQ